MDDQAPPTTSDELSERQQIVLLVLRISSASLSAIGSSTVIFKILRDRSQSRSMTPYDRIILGLSAFDIFSSMLYVINPFIMPSETGLVWAFGSAATCQVSGLLSQIGPYCAMWYNCILSYYFLLTVLSQVQLKNFVRKFEPWMHLSGLFFPITAIIGYRHEWYGVRGIQRFCAIKGNLRLFWICSGGPLVFIASSLIINNVLIYSILRKTLRSSERVAGPTLAQKRIMRESTTIMFLYVGFFLITLIPFVIAGILEGFFGFTTGNSGKIYPFLVLTFITCPLQGFFNVFIYLKPAYKRFRAANPNKNAFFVLHQALFNPDVPQLIFPGDQPVSTTIGDGDVGNPNRKLFNSNFHPNDSSSSDRSSSSDSSSNGNSEGLDAP